ncbi:MAG: beta-CASP ribonuclease aCPSF1 [Candidatus Odinarchaeota archaeon]|nr:beta-CASP ribonuclease aCPSF1 [Candidatus Odinarchaeota archaeon]
METASVKSLNEIKERIIQYLPPNAQITKIEFEGPEIAIYSKNPHVLVGNGELVKAVAKTLQKRIVVRADPSVRMDKEAAIEKIREIVPPEAEITKIIFDDTLGEVIIEAKKPGLVIGKNGVTLKEITRAILWRPVVIRKPPRDSAIVEQIRGILQETVEKRLQMLRNVGFRIHRPQVFKNEWVRVIGLGGFREVGRSAIFVQTKESNILIDCGVNVGSPEHAFPHLDIPEFSIEDLDAVIVTHAHLDHSGFIPFLFKYGYNGPVYTTRPTRNLMVLLQLDYLDVAERNGKLQPYSQKDIKKEIIHTITLEYGEVTDISPDVRLTLHNAGHILGSAIVHLHIGDGLYNIAYTGDFKYAKTRLLEPANTTFPRLETLIMESTYGAKSDIMPPRPEAEKQLIDFLNRILSRDGIALIPVLAVGRAQEIMLVIEEAIRKKKLMEVPVFIDGMILEATAIHTTHPEFLATDLRNMIFHKGYNPFTAEIFHEVGKTAREDIVESGPAIIMATSGMLNGGPSVDYFKLLAPDPKNAIIFVSYQAEGTLGRRVQKGIKEVQFPATTTTPAQVVQVNMEVVTIEGFSGHSDFKQLVRYIRNLSTMPENIIVCHGEEGKCLNLATTIHKLKNIKTMAPRNLEAIRLR